MRQNSESLISEVTALPQWRFSPCRRSTLRPLMTDTKHFAYGRQAVE